VGEKYFAFLSLLLLAGCETGSSSASREPSLIASVTEFAFKETSETARQAPSRKFPTGGGEQVTVVVIDPRNPRSFQQADGEQDIRFPIVCETGESCEFDSGSYEFRCSADTVAYYCDTRVDGSTVRLSYVSDGRFARTGGGRWEAGVWYDTAEMRQAVAPIYEEMSGVASRVYSVRAPVEARARAEEAARARARNARNDRVFDQAMAILTGVAAGLSGQPAPALPSLPSRSVATTSAARSGATTPSGGAGSDTLVMATNCVSVRRVGRIDREFVNRCGYPVVVRYCLPEIPHRSRFGCPDGEPLADMVARHYWEQARGISDTREYAATVALAANATGSIALHLANPDGSDARQALNDNVRVRPLSYIAHRCRSSEILGVCR
jgi:hypothetical protein